MAIEPSFVAGSADKHPRKLPIGVRAELTINTSLGRFTLPNFRDAARECLHRLSVGRKDLRADALLMLLAISLEVIKTWYTVVNGEVHPRVYV